MFIEPLNCPKCGQTGRPGEPNFPECRRNETQSIAKCKCGNEVDYTANRFDHDVLSNNIFLRIGALSNHFECGMLCNVKPGIAYRVRFDKPFDIPSLAQFGPCGGFLYAREQFLSNDSMTIITSVDPSDVALPPNQALSWSVYGLVEVAQLPFWHQLFYGAVVHLYHGMLRPAFFDYASAFEAFIELQLRESLTKKHGQNVCEYLLKRCWRIEERCKDLLEFATGHRLTERSDVYQPWQSMVQEVRNKVAHGTPVQMDSNSVESAHQAVFQAIRWVQSIM